MRRIVSSLLGLFATFVFAASAFGQDMVPMKIRPGWNMVGNSFGMTVNVSETFGNLFDGSIQVPGITDKVISVWKWDGYNQTWEFYSPMIDPAYMKTQARDRGHGVLTAIYPGEGFWVFAKAATALLVFDIPADHILSNWNLGGLQPGWNLIASPVSTTPSGLAAMLTPSAPPSPSDKGSNSGVVSLWMWDAKLGNWYFYAPSMAQYGPNQLRNYVYEKGLLDFDSTGKQIEKGDGFWLNYNNQPTPYYGGGKGMLGQ